MRHLYLSPTLAALVACTLAPAPAAWAATAASEAAPLPTLAYQGRLLESGVPASGSRTFVFSILDSAGAEQWNSGPQSLAVAEGLYSVVLGSAGMPALSTPILGLSGLMLHVTVAGQALAPDVNILPAFQASSAWVLIGSFSGDLGGTQNQTLVMNLQGLPLDLTTTPPTAGQALVFNGTKWVAGTVGGSGTTGTPGPAGPTGATGPQGPAGPVGATGPSGANGAQGAAGVAGPQGAPGTSPLTLSGANAVFPTGALGVGTSSPNPSALLDLESTTQGFLAPSMTSTQRQAIASPATGLMVYDTTANDLFEWNGSAWVTPGSSAYGADLTWLASVTDFKATAPGSPTTGARYIATAAWGGLGNSANQIATWNGTAWTFTTPTSLNAVFATTQANGYVFSGSAWVPFVAASLAQMGATASQVLTWNGSAWAPATPASGGVTGVSGTAPVTVTGTTTPVVSMTAASAGVSGYLTGSDWSTFNGKGSGTVTSVTGTAPISVTTGTTTPAITLGTVPLLSGGTGATTQNGAANAILPSQTSKSGQFLTTNATSVFWTPVFPSTVGKSGQVLMSDGGTSPYWSKVSIGSDASENTSAGSQSLSNVQGNTTATTSFGYAACYNLRYSGSFNTVYGAYALNNALDGVQDNVAVGAKSCRSLVTGNQNTAVGNYTLYSNDGGSGNVAVGCNSLYSSTLSQQNVAVGWNVLTASLTDTSNTAVGYNAGALINGGSSNVLMGSSSTGGTLVTGSQNVLLGAEANASAAGDSNEIVIGYGATGQGSNTTSIGNSSITTLYVNGANIVTASDARLKENVQDLGLGLDFLTRLRPVTYNYIAQPGVVREGLIAQEVEAAAQALGVTFHGVERPGTPDGRYSLSYPALVMPLINAAKELKARNDALTRELEALKAEVAAIREALAQ